MWQLIAYCYNKLASTKIAALLTALIVYQNSLEVVFSVGSSVERPNAILKLVTVLNWFITSLTNSMPLWHYSWLGNKIVVTINN